jgi:hypothetical protein
MKHGGPKFQIPLIDGHTTSLDEGCKPSQGAYRSSLSKPVPQALTHRTQLSPSVAKDSDKLVMHRVDCFGKERINHVEDDMWLYVVSERVLLLEGVDRLDILRVTGGQSARIFVFMKCVRLVFLFVNEMCGILMQCCRQISISRSWLKQKYFGMKNFTNKPSKFYHYLYERKVLAINGNGCICRGSHNFYKKNIKLHYIKK